MLGRNRQVKSLDESFKEVGLDSGKVLGEIDRMTGRLQEARRNPGAGGPPIRDESAPARITENRSLYEHGPRGGYAHGKAITLAEEARQELRAAGVDPEANVAEAMKVMKKKRKTAAQKLAARLYRKSKKSVLRKASKLYRKRNKRKILLRAKKKLKKFGAKLLAKMHKAGKRIVMSNDQALSNLRESLNNPSVSTGEGMNSYEEAAHNAGLLAMYLGEVFEVLGEDESAETMFALSDAAADLSEDLEKIAEEDLSDSQEDRLTRVLERSVAGLRMWEGVGSPTLFQAIEYVTQAE
jgi:hypothetical protein